MKLNFKKIASVLTSAVMLSSTIGLAAAANYPAPFVKGGSADVAVVWGSAAASTDLIAVTDITSDLQAQLASQTATSTGSSSVSVSGGDYVSLDRPSSKIHLNAGVADVFGRSVTKDDMPSLLQDGTYLDSDNTNHDYTQKIDVANMTLVQFDDSNYKEDTPTLGYKVASGTSFLNYTIDFTDNPSWTKLTNTDLALMGKNYRVLSVDNSTKSLTLLDSANTVTLNEGETKTVTAGAKSYDVSISFINSNNVKLVVNGETTNSLSNGDTFKLKDGSYVGVKSVLANDYAGGTKQVEFSIGNGKLVLTDGSDVEMNDNTVNGLSAFVISTTGNKLDKFGLTWNADGDQFIAPDSSPKIPGFESLKFSFAGMTYPGAETVKVTNDGDTGIQLQLPLKDGDTTLTILAINDSGNYTMVGKDSSHLLETDPDNSLTFDGTNSGNSFVASWVSGKDAESYVLYATSFNTDNNINYTTIKKRNDDAYSQKVTNGDALTLGNVVLTVGAIDKNARTVVLTAGTNVDFQTLYTRSGLKISLPIINTTTMNMYNATNMSTATALALANAKAATYSEPGLLGWNQNVTYNNTDGVLSTTQIQNLPSSYNLNFTEEDKDGNIALGSNFVLGLATTGTSTLKSTVNTVTIAGAHSAAQQIGSGTDLYLNTVYSALATSIEQDRGPDQHTATITYHTGESYGSLVLAAPSAEVTGSSAPVATTGVKKLGSVSVNDAEVASVATKNLIVVGGSCVNSVAADLLGGALCGANFQQKTTAGAGSFVIETFSRTGGKVATLVAGYDAADTTNAAKYLTTQAVDTTVGKTYVGTSATSAKLMASATTTPTTAATTTTAASTATNKTA